MEIDVNLYLNLQNARLKKEEIKNIRAAKATDKLRQRNKV